MRLLLIKGLIMSALLGSEAIAQQDIPYSPADTFAFASVQIKNIDDSPYVGKLTFKGKRGSLWTATTDKEGKVKVKLPFKDEYTVKCGEKTCHSELKLGDTPYVTYNYSAYTEPHWIFVFNYSNNKGQPLKDEEVKLTDINDSSKVFKQLTNAKGDVRFVVPLATYRVSLKYWENFRTLTPDPKSARNQRSSTFSWIGSKEQDRRAAIADSLARKAAELAKIRILEGKLGIDEPIPLIADSVLVATKVEERAKVWKTQLKTDPKCFEQHAKPVLAVFNRIAPKLNKQLVLTDVTGSMYPYMEELLIWHALNLIPKNTSKYAFFNDGDSSPDGPIGSSGGVYHCAGNIKDLKTVVGCMSRSANAGYGGAGPENDIEALLAASKKLQPGETLVLIADNNSPVRDMELLSQLKVPVRVILCGVSVEYSWGMDLNTQYLQIAKATGGSVHTIKEDIWELGAVAEGGTIQINGRAYQLKDGQFVPTSKL